MERETVQVGGMNRIEGPELTSQNVGYCGAMWDKVGRLRSAVGTVGSPQIG